MEANRALQHPLAAALYIVLLLLLSRLLLPLDQQLGTVLFFAMLLPFFFMLLRWPNTPAALFAGISIMLGGKLIYAMTKDPVTGLDETRYFEQIGAFQGISDFFPYAADHIVNQWNDLSAYPMFGLIYMPFYKLLQLEDTFSIVMLNSLLLILVVNGMYRLNEGYFSYKMPEEQRTRFHSYVIFGLLISPAFMLMSSVFAKDIACALLGLYGAGLLLRRKYVLFLLVLLYSTGLRDYAIVYTFGFYFLYTKRIRTAAVVMVAAMALLVMLIGPLGLMNSFLLVVFLFLSPNPVNPGNWNPELLYRTFEALWMTGGLVLSVLNFIRFKETRAFYIIAFVLLYTYACTLVLVGYVSISGRELEYGLGTVGDNMVRKKLPVLPLLYVVMAYSLVWARQWFQPQSLPSKQRSGMPYAGS
ncbi:hypothetical protein K0T92_05885 [Paenibacillus oenotherae]|uniref:DUF2029 domain-containing protein n=1 Tax=Paenibacillus oenotherae TaxID=1435645 RepID=A0ABS7D3W8_9BACL|nr:hypothetical protein [Paenibacillus oenotherae]MBW7474267.1 hypothetical protein [Paenibacillus oenotherae]